MRVFFSFLFFCLEEWTKHVGDERVDRGRCSNLLCALDLKDVNGVTTFDEGLLADATPGRANHRLFPRQHLERVEEAPPPALPFDPGPA